MDSLKENWSPNSCNFFTVYRTFMYDGTNFRHFFPSNDSFHPENEGFLAIIGSIFDCGTSAQNTVFQE